MSEGHLADVYASNEDQHEFVDEVAHGFLLSYGALLFHVHHSDAVHVPAHSLHVDLHLPSSCDLFIRMSMPSVAQQGLGRPLMNPMSTCLVACQSSHSCPAPRVPSTRRMGFEMLSFFVMPSSRGDIKLRFLLIGTAFMRF